MATKYIRNSRFCSLHSCNFSFQPEPVDVVRAGLRDGVIRIATDGTVEYGDAAGSLQTELRPFVAPSVPATTPPPAPATSSSSAAAPRISVESKSNSLQVRIWVRVLGGQREMCLVDVPPHFFWFHRQQAAGLGFSNRIPCFQPSSLATSLSHVRCRGRPVSSSTTLAQRQPGDFSLARRSCSLAPTHARRPQHRRPHRTHVRRGT